MRQSAVQRATRFLGPVLFIGTFLVLVIVMIAPDTGATLDAQEARLAERVAANECSPPALSTARLAEAQASDTASTAFEIFRSAAESVETTSISPDCEVLLIPAVPMTQADLISLRKELPPSAAVTRVYTSFPADERTMISYFSIPIASDVEQVIRDWKKEIELGLAENIAHSTDDEYRKSVVANLSESDAAEFLNNLDAYKADAATMLRMLETSTYDVFGVVLAPTEQFDPGALWLSERDLVALQIVPGATPRGFSPPIDPARDVANGVEGTE